MKKIAKILLPLALCFVLLAGCGQKVERANPEDYRDHPYQDQTMVYMKLDEGTYLIYEYPADSYAPVYFFISDYPDDLLVCLASDDPRDDVSPLCFTGVREVRDYLNKQ